MANWKRSLDAHSWYRPIIRMNIQHMHTSGATVMTEPSEVRLKNDEVLEKTRGERLTWRSVVCKGLC